MTPRNRTRFGSPVPAVIAVLSALALCGSSAVAQIVSDGSLGPAESLSGPAYTIGPGLGRMVGNNLFHSFGRFDLVQGESATFTGPSTLQNIVARVTGGASSIDGALATQTGGTPGLFLINPAGIVFGPHASLHLEGAFHVSTADYLRFADGARFLADLGNGSSVTAASPTAFGFLSQAPAALALDGATLSVKSGTTIDAVSGNFSITGGSLAAAGGTIRVVAADAAGEVPLDPMDTDHLTVTGFAAAALSQGATIDVSNGASAAHGGGIDIRAGSVQVDNSTVKADSLRGARGRPGQISVSVDNLSITNAGEISATTSGGGNGGSLAVTVSHSLDIDGDTATDVPTGILADSAATATGSAGSITITAGAVRLANGGQISSTAFGRGTGGDVSVDVTGALRIDGVPYLDQKHVTGIFSFRERSLGSTATNGHAGDVAVAAADIYITNTGVISSSTFGAGNGGTVMVTAEGAIVIDGQANQDQGFGFGATGILSEADTASFAGTGGAAGPVTVHAASIQLLGDGKISSDTGTSGAAGDIEVTAPVVTIDGGSISSTTIVSGQGGKINLTVDDSLSLLDAGAILTQTTGSGDAGDIVIRSGATALTSHAAVSAAASSTGAAGKVELDAASLALSGGALLSSSSSGSGAAGTVAVMVVGDFSADGLNGGLLSQATGSSDAHDVTLTAANVTFSGGAKASSDAGVTGDPTGLGFAGKVTVTAQDQVLVTGTDSAISANALGPNSSHAGTVTVTGSSVTVADRGAISTTAAGLGDGGDVTITADRVVIDDGRIDAASSGAGTSGTITIDPSSIVLENAGVISASASGSGPSGDIHLTADGITVSDAAITTESVAGGGKIFITGSNGGLLTVTDSAITSAVHGLGATDDAGNVTTLSGLLVLDGATISANAIRGHGGNLQITTQGLIASPDSLLTASSAEGISGTVAVSSLSSDVTAGLAELSGKLATTGNLSHLACGGPGHGGTAHSSLLVLGRGALPFDADEPATAFYDTPPATAMAPEIPLPAAGATLGQSTCSADGDLARGKSAF